MKEKKASIVIVLDTFQYFSCDGQCFYDLYVKPDEAQISLIWTRI